MKVNFIEVGVPDAVLRGQISEAILRLIERNVFIGGDPVDRFARRFGDFCGALCAPVANGTDALILALKALDIGPGDEVITVPFTFIATAEAITAVGASVRFVDVDPKSYTLDPALLERAITPRTAAVIPVHLYGQPADMDPILEIARKHRISVVEDAAQAHGALYKGRPVGSLGDLACFSFYPTKNLGGFGDGGAITSRSEDHIARVLQIANHGRSEQYFHVREGVNSRLDAIQAAVLDLKLDRLPQWNERRRAVAGRYVEALAGHSFIEPPSVATYASHVFHLFNVQSSWRDDLKRHLAAAGVASGVYYPLPLHLQPAYARLGLPRGSFPVSERAAERILALPMHPFMTDGDVETVCSALSAFSPGR